MKGFFYQTAISYSRRQTAKRFSTKYKTRVWNNVPKFLLSSLYSSVHLQPPWFLYLANPTTTGTTICRREERTQRFSQRSRMVEVQYSSKVWARLMHFLWLLPLNQCDIPASIKRQLCQRFHPSDSSVESVSIVYPIDNAWVCISIPRCLTPLRVRMIIKKVAWKGNPSTLLIITLLFFSR